MVEDQEWNLVVLHRLIFTNLKFSNCKIQVALLFKAYQAFLARHHEAYFLKYP